MAGGFEFLGGDLMQRAHREVDVGAAAWIVLRDQNHVESRSVALWILYMDGEDFSAEFLFQVQSGDDAVSSTRNDQSRLRRSFEQLGLFQHSPGLRNQAERQTAPGKRHAGIDEFVRCRFGVGFVQRCETHGAGQAGGLTVHAGHALADAPAAACHSRIFRNV